MGVAPGAERAVTGRLPAYLRRRVGWQIVALLLVFTALMQLFELLDVTTEIVKRGLGLRGILHYAALRLPAELVLALPLAVLLGTATALQSMARHFEIVTLRAAGVGLTRVFGWLLPVLLALAVARTAVAEVVLPEAESAMKEWWTASAPPDDARAGYWAHTDGGPVSIDAMSADGRRLTGVRLYERTPAGMIAARLSAAGARWDGREWQLEDVSELRIESGRIRLRHDAGRAWRTNLKPDEVLRLDVARPNLSSMMLADVIAGTRVGTQPTSYYRTLLYRSFTAPLGIFVMLLLAMPVAGRLARDRAGGSGLAAAFLLGLGFLLGDGIVAALGTGGRLPPLVTAIAAPLAFGAIGFWRLRAADRA